VYFIFYFILFFILKRGFSVSVDILRHITGSILQALQVLHRANVVHKNLRHSSIYLGSFGEVKVGDYSLESRINEIFSIQGNLENRKKIFALRVFFFSQMIDLRYRCILLLLEEEGKEEISTD